MGSLSYDQDEDVLRQAIRKGFKFSTSESIRCAEELNKWQRISRIVSKIDDLDSVSHLIIAGDEGGLRQAWRLIDKTRESLLVEARALNVKNYGTLTKKELKIEIERYQRDQIVRQRFERKG